MSAPYALQGTGCTKIAEHDSGDQAVFEWPGGALFLVKSYEDGKECRISMSQWSLHDLLLDPHWRVLP